MALVLLGVLGLVLKWLGIGPVAGWSWWLVLSPLMAAPVWWAISDAMGLTRRNEEKRYEDRRKQRRQETIEALGRKTPLPRRRR